MCGGYRLLQYAHFYLPTLLQRLNSICPDSYLVGGLLDHLTQRYRNHEFQATMDDRDPPYANSIYKKRYPTAYETVRQTFRFHLAEKRWGWNRNNSEAWVNFDPLITSKMLVRLQSHYEDLVADDDFSHGMQIHYGPCLFKCTYLFCTYSRRGFTTRQERDTHVANHERPFKCPVPNCIYYTLGFNVQRRCNEHLAQFHTQKFSADDLSNLKPEDAQPLLFTLTVEGDAENVQRLMSSPGGQKLSPEVVAAARLIAAEQGSLAITQLLAPLGETELSRRVVRAAVRSESIECAEWAIAKADSTDATELMKVVLNVKSERIYRKWEEYILSRLEESPQVQPEPTSAEPYSSRRYKHHNSLIDNVFKQPVFSDIKGSVLKETRLQHTLEELRAYMKPHILGAILVRIAKSSCTLSLAKQILSYGAPVDYPRVNTRPVSPRKGTGITALHAAAKKNTKDAALLIQLLVMNGAIEDMARVREEPGAKGLPQFIGVSFNDLIQLRLQYQQTPREPSSPGVTDTELKIVAEKIDLTTS
ncbi:uncharacterized protein APUU_70845A [Aspergillus puulaauensis]|uniref:Ankyrin repeat-containing domain protein n=1 Tax=Aspergillus puulaauensis TaxID=1220207 RepID=A0A7R8ATX3_9EURO|nr:uncharacterized protein APUU_70845A [Aspergillus puulaauensis]BCS29275.1 hypothetical protein APUU_70845A [Aspergillus puulaauensis]